MSKNLIPTLRYLWLTSKHKSYVFRAGLKTGAPIWRLIIHDWTKFTWHEAPHYGRQFFGDRSQPLKFSYAWNHHQKSNPHHWEYWIPLTGHDKGGYKDLEPLPMPDWAIKEMIADWMGASRAYNGEWPSELWAWLDENWESVSSRMHPETKEKVVEIVERVVGYKFKNQKS